MFAKKSSYLYKIVLILLFVSMIPFILANVYSAMLLQSQSARLVDEINEEKLKHTGLLMERTFIKLKGTIVSSISTEMSASNSGIYNMNSIVDQMQIQQKLGKMCLYSEYFDSVLYYNTNKDFILSSETGIEREIHSLYPWLRQEVESAADSVEIVVTDTRSPAGDSGKYIVEMIAKLPISYNNTKYLIFNIDIQKIYGDLVKQSSGKEEIYQYYLTNSAENILYAENHADIGKKTPYDIKKEGLVYKSHVLNVNSYKIASMNWYLVSEIDTAKLYGGIDSLMRTILWFDLIVFILILLVVLFGSKSLYKPVRFTVKKLKDIIRDRSYDEAPEFSFIDSVVNDVAAQNTTLENALERSEYRIRKKSLYNRVRYGYKDGSEDEKNAHEERRYAVAVYFKADFKDAEGQNYERIDALLSDSKAAFQFDLFSDGANDCFALFCLENDDLEAFASKLESCLCGADLADCDLTVGIGQICKGLDGIHNSYIEALYACNVGRIGENRSHIYCYSMLPVEAGANSIGNTMFNELEVAVRQKNSEKYQAILEEMFSSTRMHLRAKTKSTIWRHTSRNRNLESSTEKFLSTSGTASLQPGAPWEATN